MDWTHALHETHLHSLPFIPYSLSSTICDLFGRSSGLKVVAHKPKENEITQNEFL